MQDLLLEKGVISNAELAEWFNTTEKNFSNHKPRFLEKLKDYCDFEKQLTVKESTTIKHTAQARNVLYGKPIEEDSKGLKGTCAYIWCVKREDGEGYRYLTAEEEAIK